MSLTLRQKIWTIMDLHDFEKKLRDECKEYADMCGQIDELEAAAARGEIELQKSNILVSIRPAKKAEAEQS